MIRLRKRALLKTAVVTGASAGIGREIVRQLVRDRGMTVLATARRIDRLQKLAEELPAGQVLIESGDLADRDFRDRLWQRATNSFPEGVDLLVNNAGMGHYAEFSEASQEYFSRIFEVNVLALMDLTRKAVHHMRERRTGQVMQISSVLGFVGLPYSAAYVASKHAVNGLVKSLRYELRGTGVRVWAACPNRTESEFHSAALGHNDLDHARRSPHAAPTDRVVRSLLRGLDRRSTFVFPDLPARTIVRLSQWLPTPYEWFMERWSPGHFRKEMETGRMKTD
ncbi:SDR family oxidoreductase [soil metagenome]